MRGARDQPVRKGYTLKTLKLALLATGAAGAVTAGGFAYATVGHDTAAPTSSAKDAPASALKPVHKVAPKVPGAPSVPSVPTCLPKAVHLPKPGQLPETGLPAGLPQVPTTLPQAPGGVPQAPGAGALPTNLTPVQAGLVKAQQEVMRAQEHLTLVKQQLDKATGNLAEAKAAVAKAKSTLTAAQAKLLKHFDALPICKGGQSTQAGSNLPGKAGLPQAGLPCDKVPPAIKTQKGIAKGIDLPNGLHLAVSHAHQVKVDGRAFCAVTQKFVGEAGKFVTVERLNTPPQVTLQELAQSLKLASGKVVSLNGINTLQTPANTGMLWYSTKGYALYLSGSPETAGLLPGIATQLRTP